jgi:predicted lysophospholipase L1 biosynthesis ABC-type transport system permease subunit
VSRVVLIVRLAARDLRHHRAEAILLALALASATTTLTVGLVLRGVTNQPYESTRAATAGPDVVAEVDPPEVGTRPADLAKLRALAKSADVASYTGPYPVAATTLAVGTRRADAWAEGRSDGRVAIDQPQITSGRWALSKGVVVERSFADALGVHVGETIRLGSRSERVVGIAVTAAIAPYPLNVAFVRGRRERPGLVWTARRTALALDRSPSYLVNLRLLRPAAAPEFIDRAYNGFAPPRNVTRADAPPPYIQSADDLATAADEVIRNERKALLTGSWLLAVMALASIAVLVGSRMAEQVRRVGVLKAVGATPGLIASVLLAQYVFVASIAAAAGLFVGWLVAPAFARPSAGLIGRSAALPFESTTVIAVSIIALGVAVLATLLPAARASRTSTIEALASSARAPRRIGWLTTLSARLPVSLLLGVRLAARRPRRAFLSAASATVAVSGIVTALAAQAQLHAAGSSNVPDPRSERLGHVLLLIMVMLIAEAAVTAVFATWATVLDSQRTTALAQALGATKGQVGSGVSTAYVLPATLGALVGIPGGMALFDALSDDATATLPVWQLAAVVLATVVLSGCLATASARLAASRPVAEVLRA